MFLQGNQFDIIVDHQPLLKIFGNKSLQDITNPRLFSLQEKTLMYSFNMKYVRGVKNRADVLSRYPASQPDAYDVEDADHISGIMRFQAIEEVSSAMCSMHQRCPWILIP